MMEAILTAVFCAGSVWGVIRVELRYMRRDIDQAHKRIDRLESNSGRQVGQHQSQVAFKG